MAGNVGKDRLTPEEVVKEKAKSIKKVLLKRGLNCIFKRSTIRANV